MAANNLRFENDKYVPEINCPILILHAEDDHVVPYRLGKKVQAVCCLVVHVLKCRVCYSCMIVPKKNGQKTKEVSHFMVLNISFILDTSTFVVLRK